MQLRLPIEPATPDLDPSWQQALNYALAHGIRFGRDLVFTFGPLGGLQHGRYEPTLFWPQILLFECLFKGLLIWRWMVALRRFESTPDRVVFVLALIGVGLIADAFMLASIAVLGSLLVRDDKERRFADVLDCALIFAIGYIKFTFLALGACACLAFVTTRLWRSCGAALRAAILCLSTAIGVWALCLQWPWDLPIFVLRAWSLASGYSESQATDGAVGSRTRAAWCIVVLGSMLVLFVWWSKARRLALLTAALALLGSFVAFRASFTFHVQGAPIFFGFMTLVSIVLVTSPDLGVAKRVVLGLARAGLVVVAVDGYTHGLEAPVLGRVLSPASATLESNARALHELPDLRERLEKRKAELEAQYALPRTRAIVGDAPSDFIGSAPGWIFLNRLNWRPRPVFQSYAATTADLIQLNAEFFESARAPRFVMFQSATFLGRIPGHEDSALHRVLLRKYRPVALERGYLLFERNPETAASPAPIRRVIAEIDARPMEWTALPETTDPMVIVSIEVRYSLFGRLRQFLYHAPITLVDIQTTDGGRSSWRLVPGMAQAGIMTKPYIPFEDDWLRAYTIGASNAITSLRLRTGNHWDSLYRPTYRVIVESCTNGLPELRTEERLPIIFGSFPTPPNSCQTDSPPRYFCEGGVEFVLVSPVTTLTFDVAPGRHVLTGSVGLMPGSIELSDGVDFTVSLRAQSGETRELYARTLDRTAKDVRHAILDVPFEAQPGETLLFQTSNPPTRTREYDLPILFGLKISD
ncbi:MAG: hypothetical protein SGI72_02415 [Planctomycetota bacterium]|nr:hypothetical protein [Planctomycetota bacterium]